MKKVMKSDEKMIINEARDSYIRAIAETGRNKLIKPRNKTPKSENSELLKRSIWCILRIGAQIPFMVDESHFLTTDFLFLFFYEEEAAKSS